MEQCPRLVELDISDATQVTGIIVDVIASKLLELKRLCVSRCYNIVPAAYLAFGRMDSLRQLELFGVLAESALHALRKSLPRLDINKQLFSTVARPTTGIRRTSIWGLRVREA